MAWTAADLTLIEDAIRALLAGTPVKEKMVGGRRLEYMSLDELQALRDEMKRELAASDASTGGLPYHYITPGRSR